MTTTPGSRQPPAFLVDSAQGPHWGQLWLTGSSLFTTRLSLTADQRNSRSRAYAHASRCVSKRNGSPSHSPESSTTTSIFQDMRASPAAPSRLIASRAAVARLRPPNGLAPVEPKWCARSISQSFRMLFLPTAAHTTPHRARNCALKPTQELESERVIAPALSAVLAGQRPCLADAPKHRLALVRRGLHDILADSMDHHETPLYRARRRAEYFRTRPVAFKPMIKCPGRNTYFLTTLSKVTCGKPTREDIWHFDDYPYSSRGNVHLAKRANQLRTCP